MSVPRFSCASTTRRFWFFSASCPAVPMTSSISLAKFTGSGLSLVARSAVGSNRRSGKGRDFPDTDPDPGTPSRLGEDSAFSVQFVGPDPWAEIYAHDLGLRKASQTARLVYTSAEVAKALASGRGFRKRRPIRDRDLHQIRGDLHQTRVISFATIRALGSLISRAG